MGCCFASIVGLSSKDFADGLGVEDTTLHSTVVVSTEPQRASQLKQNPHRSPIPV